MKVHAALVLGLALIAFAQADPCVFSASNVVFEVNDILACFNSIPVDASRISRTTEALKNLIELYSFTDIVRASIAPYNMKVDLKKGLSDISQKNYTGDYAFHMDLSRLFNELNDAHTMYYAPTPYISCLGVKAFSLLPMKDENDTDAKIILQAGITKDLGWPIKTGDFVGYEVLKINGQDPRDYLMDYSHHVGTYKDKLVRFNALFGMFGWGVIDTYTFPLSDVPTEVLTLRINQALVNVTVPVKAYCSELPFTNTQSLITSIDTPPFLFRKRALTSPLKISPDIHRERITRIRTHMNKHLHHAAIIPRVDRHLTLDERLQHAVRTHVETKANRTLTVLDTVEDEFAILTYIDENNNVIPVLKVQTFAPNDEEAWIDAVVGFNKLMKRYNWTNAIVDVNKNGGGVICYTILLQALMAKNISSNLSSSKVKLTFLTASVTKNEVLWTPYNLRKTKLMGEIYESLQGMDQDYMNIDNGGLETAKQYYKSGSFNRTYSPSNITTTMSKFTYFPAECKAEIDPQLRKVTYWPKNLVVTTEGTCGSACAAFVAKMTQNNRAKILAHGGDSKSDSRTEMRTASFPGGNVVAWSDLSYYGIDVPDFNTSAMARFNWHQAFSTASYGSYPLEFDYNAFKPTNTFKYWNAVFNDNYDTEGGLDALKVLYAQAVKLWPNLNQTMPPNFQPPVRAPVSPPVRAPVQPPVRAPVSLPPVQEPAAQPPVTPPIAAPSSTVVPVATPESTTDGGSTAAIVILTIALVAALIAAAFFALKYHRLKKSVYGSMDTSNLLPFDAEE